MITGHSYISSVERKEEEWTKENTWGKMGHPNNEIISHTAKFSAVSHWDVTRYCHALSKLTAVIEHYIFRIFLVRRKGEWPRVGGGALTTQN